MVWIKAHKLFRVEQIKLELYLTDTLFASNIYDVLEIKMNRMRNWEKKGNSK